MIVTCVVEQVEMKKVIEQQQAEQLMMYALQLQLSLSTHCWHMLLGGSVVRALDSGPRGREFDSRRLRFRVTRSTQPSIPPG